jgi:methylated-DNA-[protein]-cysteine S-methyltransferase
VLSTYQSPLGLLMLEAEQHGLTRIAFPTRRRPVAETARAALAEAATQLSEATSQLKAFFAGESRAFDLPLDPRGSPLQQAVWCELRLIPYGTTISYGELAGRIDPDLYPESLEPWRRAQLVGAANGQNPLAIVVPCHRVIGADGSLTGYAGGLQRKQALLELERGGLGVSDPRRRRQYDQLSLLSSGRSDRRSSPAAGALPQLMSGLGLISRPRTFGGR